MDGLREINLDELMELLRQYEEDQDIRYVIEYFPNENYEQAVTYIHAAKQSFEAKKEVMYALLILELLSYIKLEKQEEAKTCIQALHILIPEDDKEKLLMLGELAYQVDLKITRRILSQLVHLLEENTQTSPLTMGKAYLLLAETEENMDKLPRSIKYYERAIAYFREEDPNSKLLSFLYYKIGVLYSAINKKTEAIDALKKGLAFDNGQIENKIHILVSLGSVYASMENSEDAFNYLSQALEHIENSSLSYKIIHAETLTELAFYYFDSGKVDEALPYYEKALAIYHKEKSVPNRKLGMIYMQYAYCLEHNQKPNISHAGMQYENGLRFLEKSDDSELYENALMDVISFFTTTNNKRKKRFYENKALKLSN